MKTDDIILRFFRDDIAGNVILDTDGSILYEDEKAAAILAGKTNWQAACPPVREGQKDETWDLICHGNGKSYMVATSTFTEDGRMLQIHHLTDTSMYTGLYREISNYSQELKTEKERDEMTGLYNKGKLMEMKRGLFSKQKPIAVFYMDINNLKITNDTYGHEAGDALIKKAADSLKKIEARNVMPFRVGGDEFVTVAIHVNREEAEKIKEKWEAALAELNQQDDGIECMIACGFAFGEENFVPEELFAEADRRMYDDKRSKKQTEKSREELT